MGRHNIEIEILSNEECASKYFVQRDVNDTNCYIWCVSSCNSSIPVYEKHYPVKRLVVDDIDLTKVLQTFPNDNGTFDLRKLPESEFSKFLIFDKNHVEVLADYFETLDNFHDKKFVICCEAGISRSAAIAEFLAQVFSEILNDYTLHYKHLKRYAYRKHPNMTVLNTLNEQRQRFVEILSNKIR